MRGGVAFVCIVGCTAPPIRLAEVDAGVDATVDADSAADDAWTLDDASGYPRKGCGLRAAEYVCPPDPDNTWLGNYCTDTAIEALAAACGGTGPASSSCRALLDGGTCGYCASRWLDNSPYAKVAFRRDTCLRMFSSDQCAVGWRCSEPCAAMTCVLCSGGEADRCKTDALAAGGACAGYGASVRDAGCAIPAICAKPDLITLLTATCRDGVLPTFDAGPPPKTVVVSGSLVDLGGGTANVASVSIKEHPEVSTKPAVDHTFSLAVPADVPVTLQTASANGYVRTVAATRTFATDTTGLELHVATQLYFDYTLQSGAPSGTGVVVVSVDTKSGCTFAGGKISLVPAGGKVVYASTSGAPSTAETSLVSARAFVTGVLGSVTPAIAPPSPCAQAAFPVALTTSTVAGPIDVVAGQLYDTTVYVRP